METSYLVIGHFDIPEEARAAIVRLRELGHNRLELFSPIPNHDLEEEIYRGESRSPVRFFTFIGGLTGCLGAFLMTTWMSIDYPLRVSAKPLISIPAFIVIAFECTILLGAIFTLLSMFHFSKVPYLARAWGYRPAFSEGTFGLTVTVGKSQSEAVADIMRRDGAEHVELQYVR